MALLLLYGPKQTDRSSVCHPDVGGAHPDESLQDCCTIHVNLKPSLGKVKVALMGPPTARSACDRRVKSSYEDTHTPPASFLGKGTKYRKGERDEAVRAIHCSSDPLFERGHQAREKILRAGGVCRERGELSGVSVCFTLDQVPKPLDKSLSSPLGVRTDTSTCSCRWLALFRRGGQWLRTHFTR